MHESGARHLHQIEQSLLADDPEFIAQFRQAASRLSAPGDACRRQPIVVAVDGTRASMRAVHWAASRADVTGAAVHIVHAFRWRSYPLDYGMSELQDLSGHDAAQDACRSALDLACALSPRSRVTGTLVSGAVGPAIMATGGEAGLIVVVSARLSTLRTWMSTSTLPYVLSRARCPVAVLPSTLPAEATYVGAAPVCVGVTGSPVDVAALTEALRIATAHRSELRVVCPAGAEQSTGSLLRMLGQDSSTTPQIVPSEDVAASLARLAPTAHTVVCDRSQLRLTRPGHGRAGRRLLDVSRGPVLLTAPRRGGGHHA